MKKVLIIFYLFLLLVFSACQKSLSDDYGYEYEAIKSELEVSKSSLDFSGNGQSLPLLIKCNSYWEVECSVSWLSLNYWSGGGNGSLNIIATANPSTSASRNTVITITDGIQTVAVNVTQAPSDETLSVSESVLNVPYSGAASYVMVSGNAEWTVASDASWCTVSRLSSGITIKTSENNTYTPRSATVTVKGSSLSASIKVSQSGISEPVVKDMSVSSVTQTSATCSFAYSSSDIGISRCGVCYSSSTKEPNVDDKVKYNSVSSYSGTASLELTGLTKNTTYYARPYVTTSVGTTYGTVVQFTTAKSNSPSEGDNPTPSY